jgi:4-hydroxyacetophenone monooxygenase
MRSWDKNAAGKVLTTSPWRLVDYWGWTKTPDLADFELR